MKNFLTKYIDSGKWRQIFLAACFILLTFSTFWQILGKNFGYADNGAFGTHLWSNGISLIKRPDYKYFNDPVNYKISPEALQKKKLNTIDFSVRLNRSLLSSFSEIFDLRVWGSQWLIFFLAGAGILLYEIRRIKDPLWMCFSALLVTLTGSCPLLTAYFPTLYENGIFFGTFVLFSGLSLLSFTPRSKWAATLLFTGQLALLFAVGGLKIYYTSLLFLFLPFTIWCFHRDVITKIPCRALKFLTLSIIIAGVCISSAAMTWKILSQSNSDITKFDFYFKYVLPHISRDVKFLKARGFSDQDITRIRDQYHNGYWANPGFFKKYFLYKMIDMPRTSLYFSHPKLLLKSLDYWDKSSHHFPVQKPGITSKNSPDQQPLRPYSLLHTLLSKQICQYLLVFTLAVFFFCSLTCYCRQSPRIRILLFYAGLCCAPIIFIPLSLAFHPLDEYLIYDVSGFLLLLSAVTGTILLYRTLQDFSGEKLKTILSGAAAEFRWLLLCCFCTLIMEFIFHGTFLPQTFPVAPKFYFECLLMIILALPFRILVGRKNSFSLLLTGAIFWGFSNNIKTKLSGKPLLPDEFFSLEHVWATIHFIWRGKIFLFTLLFLLLFLVFFIWNIKKDFHKLKKHIRLRLLFFAATLCLACYTLASTPFPKNFFPPDWKVEGLLESFYEDGLLNRFLERRKHSVKAPEQIHIQRWSEEQKKISEAAKKYTFDPNFKPHVLFILNESAFDPAKIPGLKFQKASPFPIKELCRKIQFSPDHSTFTGTLQVPVFGGTTANSEFEIMTGITSFISRQLPYTQLSSRKINTIATRLKERGYKTSFLHPHPLTLYSCRDVLPNMDIDNLFSKDYFPKVRGDFPYYPDAPFYDEVISFLQKNTDQPQFMLCASIQNHGPYAAPRLTHVPAFPFTAPSKLPPQFHAALSRYLTGMSLTYKALDSFFIQLRDKIKRPTLVVVFGDHQPCLNWKYFIPNYASIEKYFKYKTEYLIWANYRLPHPEQFRGEMKLFELGKRSVFAGGALPYDGYIYLFDKLKNSRLLMDPHAPFDFIDKALKGNSIEQELDPYLRMYHVLSYKDFTNK